MTFRSKIFLLAGLIACWLSPNVLAQDGSTYGYPNKIELEYLSSLERAQKFEREERWDAAVAQYQSVLEKCRDNVVQSTDIRPDLVSGLLTTQLFIGIEQYVSTKLRNLPPDGKKAYRDLYDIQASVLLRKALQNNSEEKLREIVLRYPISSSVQDCLIQIGELSFERGEIEAAYYNVLRADELLAENDIRVTNVSLLLAVLSTLTGDKATTERMLAKQKAQPEFKTKYEEAMKNATLRRVVAVQEWPMAGGNLDRSAEVQFSTSTFSPAWKVSLDPAVKVNPQAWWEANLLLFGDNLIGRKGNTVFAVKISDGAPAWKTVIPAAKQAVGINITALSDLMISGGVVYGCEGGTIFALKAESGELIWNKPVTLTKSGPADMQPGASFTAPLTFGGNLYLGLNRTGQDCTSYIQCYDSTTCEFKWERYVSSCSFGQNQPRGERPPMPLALYAGEIIFATNAGAVATIDRFTGAPRWLFLYPSYSTFFWKPSLPVMHGENLYVAPRDSSALYAIEFSSGEELDKIEIRLLDKRHDNFIGIRGDLLFLGGKDIAAYSVKSVEESFLENRWAFALTDTEQWGGAVPSEKHLYLPTQHGLLVLEYDSQSAKIADWTPAAIVEEYPGNLLAIGERVFSHSDNFIQSFVDTTAEYTRLVERAKTEPGDFQLYYQQGVCLEKLKREPEALSAFETAFKKRPADAKPEQIRIAISQKIVGLSTRLLPIVEAAKKEAFLRDKLQFAADGETQGKLLKELGEMLESAGKFADAARCWSQMIDFKNENLISFGAAKILPTAMGHERLRRLAMKSGKSIAVLLEGGDKPLTPEAIAPLSFDQLFEIQWKMPNSVRADSAVLTLCDRLKDARDFPAAIYFLEEKDRLAPDPSVSLRLLQLYELTQNYYAAGEVLKRAKEEWGAEPAIENRTWAQLADEKLATDAYRAAAFKFHENKMAFPWIETPVVRTNFGGMAVATGPAPEQYRDYVLLYNAARRDAGELACLDLKTTKVVWRKKMTVYQLNQFYWIDKNMAVVVQGSVLWLDPANGNLVKKVDVSGVPVYQDGLFLFYAVSGQNVAVVNTVDLKKMELRSTENLWQKVSDILRAKAGDSRHMSFSLRGDDILLTKNKMLLALRNINSLVVVDREKGTLLDVLELPPQSQTMRVVSENVLQVWIPSRASAVEIDLTTKKSNPLVPFNIGAVRSNIVSMIPYGTEWLIQTGTSLALTNMKKGDPAWTTNLTGANFPPRIVDRGTAYFSNAKERTLSEVELVGGKIVRNKAVPFIEDPKVTFLVLTPEKIVWGVNVQEKTGPMGKIPAQCSIYVYDRTLHQIVWSRTFNEGAIKVLATQNNYLFAFLTTGEIYRYSAE